MYVYIYLHNMYNMFPWQIAHRLQRFNPTTPSSCSSPTSRQIWAACHRRHNAICWRGIATSEPCWGQHFFEFPIVAAGGGKSEGLRKAFFFLQRTFFFVSRFWKNVLMLSCLLISQNGVCQHVSVILSQKLGALFLIYTFMINDSVYLCIILCFCMISNMIDRSTPLQCVSALLCRWYMQRHFDLACFSAPCRLGRRWTANPMKHRHRMLAMLDTWYIHNIYIHNIYIYT